METPLFFPSPPPAPSGVNCTFWPSSALPGVEEEGYLPKGQLAKDRGETWEAGRGKEQMKAGGERSPRGAARVVTLSFWIPGRASCAVQDRTGKRACSCLAYIPTCSLDTHSHSSFPDCKRNTCSLKKKMRKIKKSRSSYPQISMLSILCIPSHFFTYLNI